MDSCFKYAFTLLALGVVVSQGVASEAEATVKSQPRGDFCARPDLKDYEKPLRDLPPLKSAPRGQLPFASLPVRLGVISYPINSGRIMAGSGVFGYDIRGLRDGVVVNWTVDSTLSRINRGGIQGPIVAEGSAHVVRVTSVANSRLLLSTPSQPGSYRYDIAFATDDGVQLAKYSRYLQIVRPNLFVRVGISKKTFSPGEVVRSRIENVGAELIEYTGRFVLERRIESSWRFVAGGPQGPGFASRYRLGAGSTSGCRAIELPSDLDAGRYRLVRTVSLSQLDPGRMAPELRRTVEFRVRG